MDEQKIDSLARALAGWASRRTVLRAATGGGAAAFALATSEPRGLHAAPRRQTAPCSQLIAFAKHAAKTRAGVQCVECECDGAKTITIQQGLDSTLFEGPCDESGHLIPNDETSILSIKVDRVVRSPGPCNTWSGYHSGTFEILVAGAAVVTGQLFGSDGFRTEIGSEDCCDQTRDEGTLIGDGVGTLAGWQLIASYTSIFPAGDESIPLCEPTAWESWELSLAGMLVGPCGGGIADLVPVPDPERKFCVFEENQLLVTVLNQGAGSSGPSTLEVDFGAFGVRLETTPALAAGASTVVALPLPVGCHNADCEFTITVDSLSVVPESDELNNKVSETCVG